VLDPDSPVPSGLQHPRFVATPLTTSIAALDYAAYMTSPDVVRSHSDGRWPTDEFTFAEDLALVAQHQDDHENRRAFTFALLTPSRTESLGCLYLNPLVDYLRRVDADPQLVDSVPTTSAMVTWWLRQDQQDTGLTAAVVDAVNNWLLDDWPIELHLFRILPDERPSRSALDDLGLRPDQLDLPGEKRPYLWYRSA
jgi:RimJ/RimL family protein N-acetyltransferase